MSLPLRCLIGACGIPLHPRPQELLPVCDGQPTAERIGSGSGLRNNPPMAWEWVAPTATAIAGATGIFFTWLAGAQARSQAERLGRRAEALAERSRVIKERRDAYLAVLRYSQIEMRRLKYQREGEREKLSQLEHKWSKAERVSLQTEAETAVEAFGSDEMRKIIAAVREDELGTLEDRWQAFYDRFVKQARLELGSDFYDWFVEQARLELRSDSTHGNPRAPSA